MRAGISAAIVIGLAEQLGSVTSMKPETSDDALVPSDLLLEMRAAAEEHRAPSD
jgi:hypothetical protein